ncbi:hypothetical protein HDU98_007083 [Podochytrium sp. JEL0797]|nr:hypothetical protein HDU98_007083 [Podochytrium sp. JEL0797]
MTKSTMPQPAKVRISTGAAYQRFMKAEYARLKAEYPELSRPEILRIIAELWKTAETNPILKP